MFTRYLKEDVTPVDVAELLVQQQGSYVLKDGEESDLAELLLSDLGDPQTVLSSSVLYKKGRYTCSGSKKLLDDTLVRKLIFEGSGGHSQEFQEQLTRLMSITASNRQKSIKFDLLVECVGNSHDPVLG